MLTELVARIQADRLNGIETRIELDPSEVLRLQAALMTDGGTVTYEPNPKPLPPGAVMMFLGVPVYEKR